MRLSPLESFDCLLQIVNACQDDTEWLSIYNELSLHRGVHNFRIPVFLMHLVPNLVLSLVLVFYCGSVLEEIHCFWRTVDKSGSYFGTVDEIGSYFKALDVETLVVKTLDVEMRMMCYLDEVIVLACIQSHYWASWVHAHWESCYHYVPPG